MSAKQPGGGGRRISGALEVPQSKRRPQPKTSRRSSVSYAGSSSAAPPPPAPSSSSSAPPPTPAAARSGASPSAASAGELEPMKVRPSEFLTSPTSAQRQGALTPTDLLPTADSPAAAAAAGVARLLPIEPSPRHSAGPRRPPSAASSSSSWSPAAAAASAAAASAHGTPLPGTPRPGTPLSLVEALLGRSTSPLSSLAETLTEYPPPAMAPPSAASVSPKAGPAQAPALLAAALSAVRVAAAKGAAASSSGARSPGSAGGGASPCSSAGHPRRPPPGLPSPAPAPAPVGLVTSPMSPEALLPFFSAAASPQSRKPTRPQQPFPSRPSLGLASILGETPSTAFGTALAGARDSPFERNSSSSPPSALTPAPSPKSFDLLAEAEAAAARAETPAVTLGSSLHGTQRCQPCAWVWKPEGCWRGYNCKFCHICPEGELKARKKAKNARVREQKMERRAAEAAAMGADAVADEATDEEEVTDEDQEQKQQQLDSEQQLPEEEQGTKDTGKEVVSKVSSVDTEDL